MQTLCDNGALMLDGHQLDGTFRMHLDGERRRPGRTDLDVLRVHA